VVTVGFGTPGGATIPLLERGGADVKRDQDGEVVVTRYDETLLREVAEAAGGEFIPADATDKGTRVRRALADLEGQRREEQQRLARPVRYQWFLGLALLILLLDAYLADGGRLRRRVVAALFVLVLPNVAAAQGDLLQDAIKAHKDGRILPAIRTYRDVLGSGDRRPIVLYNLGTALLAADSLDAAVDALERASFAPDPELRRRSLYNLGLAYLKRGMRGDGDARSNALRSARRSFRTVLLETPGDKDAQWNYELSLRAPQGGGGGGGAAPPQQGPQQRPTEPQGQMSRQQAEALLDAASREERETQAKRQRGARAPRVRGEKDW
jgi:tetratricopeptide (TPR) repeat protein